MATQPLVNAVADDGCDVATGDLSSVQHIMDPGVVTDVPKDIVPAALAAPRNHDAQVADDSDDDEGNLNPAAPGTKVIHACSGPDRPGSFLEHLRSMQIECTNFDIVVDRSRDLLDSAAWASLSVQVESGIFHGMGSGPVCTTFSGVRGVSGGPPPVRGLGRDIFGFKIFNN